MYEALKTKGAKTDLLIIPDVDHSFVGKTPEDTHTTMNLKKTLAFIRAIWGANLGGKE